MCTIAERGRASLLASAQICSLLFFNSETNWFEGCSLVASITKRLESVAHGIRTYEFELMLHLFVAVPALAPRVGLFCFKTYFERLL